MSMQVTHATSERQKLQTLAHFGEYFAGVLWDDYGGIFRGPTRLDPTAPPRERRPLTCGVPEVFPVTTTDGVALKLSRYNGGTRGPVVLVHGMGASSRLFSTDTVDPNLTEYLWAHGFDVWLFDWRGSPLLPVSDTSFNGDQVAAHDFPAAEAIVRAETGRSDVHWVVHCVGSITFFMSTLSGAVTPASIAALQVATDTIAPWLTNVKVDLHLAQLLELVHVKTMTTDAYSNERWIQRRVDDLLELYPIPAGQRCTSAVCHRVSFLYGLCWQHEQMSDETHSAVHEMFGVVNLDMMRHLARCTSEKQLVDAHGADTYLPHADRLSMPITLLSGAKSHVWNPESTEATLHRLTDQVGNTHVQRVLFAERGHLDPVIGRTASVDVYPALLAHLDRVGA
jgi:cholesterol oxidase